VTSPHALVTCTPRPDGFQSPLRLFWCGSVVLYGVINLCEETYLPLRFRKLSDLCQTYLLDRIRIH